MDDVVAQMSGWQQQGQGPGSVSRANSLGLPRLPGRGPSDGGNATASVGGASAGGGGGGGGLGSGGRSVRAVGGGLTTAMDADVPLPAALQSLMSMSGDPSSTGTSEGPASGGGYGGAGAESYSSMADEFDEEEEEEDDDEEEEGSTGGGGGGKKDGSSSASGAADMLPRLRFGGAAARASAGSSTRSSARRAAKKKGASVVGSSAAASAASGGGGSRSAGSGAHGGHGSAKGNARKKQRGGGGSVAGGGAVAVEAAGMDDGGSDPDGGGGQEGAVSEERQKERNREHARNTRLRKKAYIETLRHQLQELADAKGESTAGAQAAVERETERQQLKKQVVQTFLLYRARGELDRCGSRFAVDGSVRRRPAGVVSLTESLTHSRPLFPPYPYPTPTHKTQPAVAGHPGQGLCLEAARDPLPIFPRLGRAAGPGAARDGRRRGGAGHGLLRGAARLARAPARLPRPRAVLRGGRVHHRGRGLGAFWGLGLFVVRGALGCCGGLGCVVPWIWMALMI